MDVTPLVEKRLNALTERIVTEIQSRFPQGVKIYEIQNIVEHELLEAKEYALAEEYITYRTQRDFERSKRQILTLASINFSTKTRQLSMKMLIKTAMSLTPSVI